MSFAEQVRGWAHKADERLTLAIRKIALNVFSEVILMSPVDTGRFRGNWQVAIGNVPTGTLELEDKTGQATISKAQAEALRLQQGQVIYLVNNLPYAIPLEYGHSKQAPEGMVRKTVQRYRPIVDAIARELSEQ